jgi:hypothetical protein
MAAKYILSALAIAFLFTASVTFMRGPGTSHPQSRTWLITGAIFAVVSIYLWVKG